MPERVFREGLQKRRGPETSTYRQVAARGRNLETKSTLPAQITPHPRLPPLLTRVSSTSQHRRPTPALRAVPKESREENTS
eukprot:7553680-Pyramimonas_sp.AAC.1